MLYFLCAVGTHEKLHINKTQNTTDGTVLHFLDNNLIQAALVA